MQGILKGAAGGKGFRSRKKAHKVYFPAEESEVIGEGGEDAGPPSDEDDDDAVDEEDWCAPPVEDDPQEREKERVSHEQFISPSDKNNENL